MLAKNILAILALAVAAISASPVAKGGDLSSNTLIGGDGDGSQGAENSGQNAGNSASNKGNVKGSYTVEQAAMTCGNGQLNCCNKIETKGNTENGIIGALFGSGDVGIQCTPINLLIPVLPMDQACKQKVACCQGDTSDVPPSHPSFKKFRNHGIPPKRYLILEEGFEEVDLGFA
ncbi:hypothetical protein RUND412_001097 [Rhizina undulata]